MYLVPLTVEADHPEDRPYQAIEALTAWPDQSGAAVSPWPEGTKIELVQGIKNGTATVNITNLKSGAFGSSREAFALDSLVYTLTQFSEPGIKRVQVLVDGKTQKAGQACGRQPPPLEPIHITGFPGVTASPTRIMPWLLLCILPSKVPCTWSR